MSIALKPCPFCGGDAYWAYVVDNNGVWVGCKDNDNYSEEPKCRIRPFIKRCRENKEESLEIAIKDWNNRPNPWQTGTPTEEGLYAVYYWDDHNPSATPCEVLYNGFLSPDGEGNWIDIDGERRFIDDDIVRWQKIEL